MKALTVSGLFPAASDVALQGIVLHAGSQGTVVLPSNLFNRIAAGE